MKKLLLTLLVGLPASMVADLGFHNLYIMKDGNELALNDTDRVDLAAKDNLEDLSGDKKTLSPAVFRSSADKPVTL